MNLPGPDWLLAGYHKSGLEQASAPVLIGMNGQKHLQASLKDSIDSLIFAWDGMKRYPGLLRWSWTRRGLITVEEMANLHPEMTAQEKKECASHSSPFQNLVPEIPLLVPYLARMKKSLNICCFQIRIVSLGVSKWIEDIEKIFLLSEQGSALCFLGIENYLRPTIAEATRDALPGRVTHIWQMEDVGEEGAGDCWINLPVLMQQHADKNFAKYQLDVFEGQKRLTRGEIKEAKYEAIRSNSKRPLVLMNATGEPATARYIKEHMTCEGNGIFTLKAWKLCFSRHFFYRPHTMHTYKRAHPHAIGGGHHAEQTKWKIPSYKGSHRMSQDEPQINQFDLRSQNLPGRGAFYHHCL